MLCEICGENEATFHYSEVVNGNKTEHHLCSECAAKTDISYYTAISDETYRAQYDDVKVKVTYRGKSTADNTPDPNAHILQVRYICDWDMP